MDSNEATPTAQVDAIVMPCPFCGAAGADCDVMEDHVLCRVCQAMGPVQTYSDDDPEDYEPPNGEELWNDRARAATEVKLRQLVVAASHLIKAATGPDGGPTDWNETRDRWMAHVDVLEADNS